MDESMNKVMDKVEVLSGDINSISSDIVSKYCSELDDYMTIIDDKLRTTNSTSIPNSVIEEYILNLASILYFTGSAQEDLGVKEDICKSIRTEVYNKIRESASGTVADKDAAATMASQTETLTLSIYSRAYKKVKLRMDAGYEMLNSLKKVMNRRIAEAELSNSRYLGGTRNDG
jgi:hypothetical protein